MDDSPPTHLLQANTFGGFGYAAIGRIRLRNAAIGFANTPHSFLETPFVRLVMSYLPIAAAGTASGAVQ